MEYEGNVARSGVRGNLPGVVSQWLAITRHCSQCTDGCVFFPLCMFVAVDVDG